MFTFSNQPQSIWRIIANSFRLYRASISKIWYWQIIFTLAALLVLSPFGALHAWIKPNPATFFTSGHMTSSITIVSAALFTLLIALFILLLGQCFTYNRMEAVATGGDTGIKTSLRLALKKMPKVFAATLILFFVLILVFVCINLLQIAILKIVPFDKLVTLAGIIIAYAFTMAIAILVILYPLFILIDNNGVFRSLKNSVTHMRKNFWRALGLFILISLAGLIITPVLLLSTAQLLLTLPQSSPILSAIGTLGFLLFYVLFYAFTAPVFNVLLLTLYHDVKVRARL